MKKIVVTNNQDLTEGQMHRLNQLGDVRYYDSLPESAKEYLKRVEGADVICSGMAGLKDAYPQLKNVYIALPFVSAAFVDLDVLKKNNVLISNAPGSNRHAVSEWIIGMIILMMRNFPYFLNRTETLRKDGKLPPITPGLAGNNITILGQGNIGKRVGEITSVLGMSVNYFKRGDNLAESVRGADVVVNTLSSNPSTRKILNEGFFRSVKAGSYFVSVARSENIDEDAMLRALDEGRLKGVAIDCGDILVGDTDDPYYQKLLKHRGVYATPHIAYNSEMSRKIGTDIMIENVKNFLAGSPTNTLN